MVDNKITDFDEYKLEESKKNETSLAAALAAAEMSEDDED